VLFGEERPRDRAGEGVPGEIEDTEDRWQRDPHWERTGDWESVARRGEERDGEHGDVSREVECDAGDAEVGGVGRRIAA
jgi:hypothetical protein